MKDWFIIINWVDVGVLTMKTKLFPRSGEINDFVEIVLRSGCTVDFSTRCMLIVSQRGCAAREKKKKSFYHLHTYLPKRVWQEWVSRASGPR